LHLLAHHAVEEVLEEAADDVHDHLLPWEDGVGEVSCRPLL
jgi:hypothetical protein